MLEEVRSPALGSVLMERPGRLRIPGVEESTNRLLLAARLGATELVATSPVADLDGGRGVEEGIDRGCPVAREAFCTRGKFIVPTSRAY